MTDDEIRTLPLDEIARRCPTRTAMVEAVKQAENIAFRVNAQPSTLSGEVAIHLERRALLLGRDYLAPWTNAINIFDALGEAIALVAQVEALISAARVEELGACALIVRKRKECHEWRHCGATSDAESIATASRVNESDEILMAIQARMQGAE